MELFSVSNLKSPLMISPSPTPKHALAAPQWAPPPKTLPKSGGARMIKCGKDSDSLGFELERELEEIESKGKHWRGMMNCKETTTTTTTTTLEELLECLEREAIMGEDQGRDPTDYNRRAFIFDKSSKVFQALKQIRAAPTNQ